MAPGNSVMQFAAILTFLCSLSRCSGVRESCNWDSRRTLEWQSYKQIATVAGSYIPGDLNWNRPQYSLAPCFMVERKFEAFAGCPSKVKMTLDEKCARLLFDSASEHAAQFPIDVGFPCSTCTSQFLHPDETTPLVCRHPCLFVRAKCLK